MIISVASGKGGTGKTTIATNLAKSLDLPVQLLDCDVEEPNAHIFMKPEIKGQEAIKAVVPEVDLSKCDHCRKCEEICQFKAITDLGATVLTFPEMCHSCKGCIMVCPQKAISQGYRELGTVKTGKSGMVDLIWGELRIGEAMSPPLIKAVKDKTDKEKIVIIDAPPGTSCPVITTVRGTDFVVLVTEPTPFGLNDLVLAVEAVRTLGLDFGIVLNRSDSGDNKVKEYAKKQGIPILMEISDRRKIAESYSRGDIMIDIFPEMKKKFQSLFHKIESGCKNKNPLP